MNNHEKENDVKYDGDVKIETPFLKKLDNFWYHHKFGTIVTVFVIITVTICLVQLFQKQTHDLYVMYAGPSSVSADTQRNIIRDLASVAEDYNGDGETVVKLQSLQVLTQEQINKFVEKNNKETDPEKKLDSTTLGMILNTYQSNADLFEQEILSGEAVICLLDPGQYKMVKDAEGFLPLEEVLGYKPEAAIDDYSIKLRDTSFGSYFSSLKSLPADTVVCVRRISTFSFLHSKKRTQEYHGYALEYFRTLFEFEVEALE